MVKFGFQESENQMYFTITVFDVSNQSKESQQSVSTPFPYNWRIDATDHKIDVIFRPSSHLQFHDQMLVLMLDY